MTDPKWLLGGLVVVGLAGVTVWSLLPQTVPSENSAEWTSQGPVFNPADRSAAQAPLARPSPESPQRPSRRLAVLPMELNEPSASAAAPQPPKAPAAAVARKLPNMGPGDSGMQVDAAQFTADAGGEAFHAEGALSPQGFGKSGGAASPGGGGTGAMAPGAAPKTAPAGALDAGATAAQAVASGRTAPPIAGVAKARTGRPGRSGFQSETQRGGGSAALGSSPGGGARALAAAVQGGAGGGGAAPVGGAGGAVVNGGAAGAPTTANAAGLNAPANAAPAGGDMGNVQQNDGGNATGQPGGLQKTTPGDPDAGKDPATQGQINGWKGKLSAQADGLSSDVAGPAAFQLGLMSKDYGANSGKASVALEACGQRVKSDIAYFAGSPFPDAAAGLPDVDKALHDPDEGIVTRLQANGGRLSNTYVCLNRMGGDVGMFYKYGYAMECHGNADAGLAQWSSDLQKISSLQNALDGWANSQIAYFQYGCPDPAHPTAKQKPYCDGLARVQASKATEDGQLGGARSALAMPWKAINAVRAARFPGLIDRHRQAVAQIKGEEEGLALPHAEASGDARARIADAVTQLGLASAGWNQAVTGAVPEDQRGSVAAQAEQQVVQAMTNLRQAAADFGKVAGSAPQQ
ncbi:MAG: hypothetical protein NTX64_18575 [Elusimicrobia bacterium]|nr:hypothetical protein [Elusimicrobiota bacterium]